MYFSATMPRMAAVAFLQGVVFSSSNDGSETHAEIWPCQRPSSPVTVIIMLATDSKTLREIPVGSGIFPSCEGSTSVRDIRTSAAAIAHSI